MQKDAAAKAEADKEAGKAKADAAAKAKPSPAAAPAEKVVSTSGFQYGALLHIACLETGTRIALPPSK